jgi:hypothetical protein
MVTNAARALTHDSKYTVRSVSVLKLENADGDLTDNPEEGRDERDYGMPVCMLHALEMSNEGVFHFHVS